MEGLAVHKTITVAAPLEKAFRVFTEGMSTWWPLDTHHIGQADAAEAVMEPRQGGRWYERGTDGSECEWGKVLVWDAPNRVVLAWMISPDWQHDSDEASTSEVDVRFVADGPEVTRVELTHGKLEHYGDRGTEMQGIFDGDGGWNALLQRFADAV
ncbi:MAG: hypothetical protein QOJ09_690 [Actinomycetota bacterium]|nr:hypothetical protein [Actinomycetota bacterium]